MQTGEQFDNNCLDELGLQFLDSLHVESKGSFCSDFAGVAQW